MPLERVAVVDTQQVGNAPVLPAGHGSFGAERSVPIVAAGVSSQLARHQVAPVAAGGTAGWLGTGAAQHPVVGTHRKSVHARAGISRREWTRSTLARSHISRAVAELSEVQLVSGRSQAAVGVLQSRGKRSPSGVTPVWVVTFLVNCIALVLVIRRRLGCCGRFYCFGLLPDCGLCRDCGLTSYAQVALGLCLEQLRLASTNHR